MNVLIVFELVPEQCNMYLCEMTAEEFNKFKVCHNEFQGTEDCKVDDVIEELNVYVLAYNNLLSEDNEKGKPEVIDDRVDFVIHTGVMM